jgi:hypothetical protein
MWLPCRCVLCLHRLTNCEAGIDHLHFAQGTERGSEVAKATQLELRLGQDGPPSASSPSSALDQLQVRPL